MPHENIVATGLYVAARSEGLRGGTLRLQRAFEEAEGSWFHEASEDAFEFLRAFGYHGLLPLGQLETPDNRMLVRGVSFKVGKADVGWNAVTRCLDAQVFPNSHVQKARKMVNVGDEPAKQRIVAFLLVNPLVRIVSTKE
eukprot:scaffold3504_cov240-Pinguiococcus_pyrenoidosus.AAC.74